MLCFVTIISILLNLLCVWILIRNASSHSCFRVDLVSTHMPGQGGFSLCPHDKTALFLMRESVPNGEVLLLARFHGKTRREARQSKNNNNKEDF